MMMMGLFFAYKSQMLNFKIGSKISEKRFQNIRLRRLKNLSQVNEHNAKSGTGPQKGIMGVNFEIAT